MTAIVLPDIDKSTIDELRKRIPNLSEIELPKLETVGKTADEKIDQLLGRSRSPVWPWVAAGIGLVAIVGAVSAWFAWWRRPATINDEPWTSPGDEQVTTPFGEQTDLDRDRATNQILGGTGMTAAETSLGSGAYPAEEA
jgi:hypothetical protein